MFKRRKNKKASITITYDARKLKRNMVCKPEKKKFEIVGLSPKEIDAIRAFIFSLEADSNEYLVEPDSFRINGQKIPIFYYNAFENFKNNS